MAERAVLSADSGIAAAQTWIDEIANNIANSNTIGYKSSEVQFQDLLAQQISGASAPPAGSLGAGVNPVAIGSGVTVGSSAVDLSEGSLQQTGVSTDVAINGSGYLVVASGGQQAFTRNGSLTIDANGNIATHNGGLVQGWQANGSGAINTNAPLTGIKIPTGTTIGAQATGAFTLGGNLPAWGGTGAQPTETSTLTAYDSLGDAIPVTLTFTGVSGTPNQWTVQASAPSPTGVTENLFTAGKLPLVTFDPTNGQVKTITIPGGGTGTSTTNTDGSFSLAVGTMPAGYSFPATDTWAFNLGAPGSANAVTQYAGQSTLAIQSQDGHSSGTLDSYSIGSDGIITGSFSDGTTLSLGQIALADFSNATGLLDQGNGTFTVTPNSGAPQIGTAGTGGRGAMLGGQLEQSNVNIDQALTSLIDAQVAYTANTKPLTAEQQALQALEQIP